MNTMKATDDVEQNPVETCGLYLRNGVEEDGVIDDDVWWCLDPGTYVVDDGSWPWIYSVVGI